MTFMAYNRSLPVALLAVLISSCGGSPGSTANSPNGGGTTAAPNSSCSGFPWCDTSLTPAVRAALLVDELTLNEKFQLMAGDDPASAANGVPAVGVSNGIERVSLNTVFYSDGPIGVREGDSPTTAHPAPIALAASFNLELARQTGAAIANEVKHYGNDVLHAPTVDVVRILVHGRVFETYGEDPYLTAELAVPWIEGSQSDGILGNVKHYVVNTQEGQVGAPPITGVVGSRFLVNAIIDERVLRELYLPPFEAAVKRADVGSVMCAYNYVNGAPACASESLLITILRDEWGFDGYVLTDYYFAQKDTINSANNGNDLEMPFGLHYSQQRLQNAVDTGLITEATIDERVGNQLRTHFKYGLIDRDNYPTDGDAIDFASHNAIALQTAEQGTVLLRNEGLLPLNAVALTSIAVIGATADEYVNGGGSSAVNPAILTTPLTSIRARVGPDVTVTFDDGSNGARAALLAASSDVALVFVTDNATEGQDRACLNLSCPGEQGQNQDDLITLVAAANPDTVVILQTGSAVLTPWRNSVPAILEAWYPGQSGGPAIASILFGDLNPGGKLPLSFPDSADDTPYANNPAQYPGIPAPDPGGSTFQASFSEGLLIGYRWYDAQGITPAYPYGFGLSYTNYAYSNLQVSGNDAELTVSATITNTGSRSGTEIAQLYVAIPSPGGLPQPPRQLKGFQRITLAPGASGTVQFALDERSFAYWDTANNRFDVVTGCHQIQVGRHSRDLPLSATVPLAGGACP